MTKLKLDPSKCSHASYAGQCQNPPVEGKKWCIECRQRQSNFRDNRKLTGICECCPLPARKGKLRCEQHAREACLLYARRIEKSLRLGTCVDCRREPFVYGRRCKPCWFASIAHGNGGRKRGPEIQQLFEAQGGKCIYTGVALTPTINASLDHKIPRARGGTDDIHNLQWISLSVNHAKRALSETEFLALCESVVQFFKKP